MCALHRCFDSVLEFWQERKAMSKLMTAQDVLLLFYFLKHNAIIRTYDVQIPKTPKPYMVGS